MLIMSRKPGDTIAIGDKIVVKVLELRSGRVQLGIDAPREIKVEVIETPEQPEPQGK